MTGGNTLEVHEDVSEHEDGDAAVMSVAEDVSSGSTSIPVAGGSKKIKVLSVGTALLK